MLKKILLSGFGLALFGLSRLAFNAVALNGFGEAQAGALNVALSLAILAALPVTTFLGATTVRYVAAARGEGREGRVGWLIRWLLGLCLVVVGLTVVALFGFRDELAADRGISSALVDQALIVAFGYGTYQFFRNVLYAVDRVGAYGKLELVSAVVFFVGLGAATWLRLADWLPSAFAAGYGAFSIGGLWLVRARLLAPCPPEERAPWGPMIVYSLYAFIGSTSSLGTREIAILIAPDVVPMAEVAYLGLCVSLLTPLQFMPRMLRTVVFAQSAEQAGRGDHAALARSISEVSHWLLMLNIPLCAGLMILAAPVLELLGGTATTEHIWVLRVLTAAAAIEIVATPATNALPGAGNIELPAWSAVAGLVAAALVWFAANERFGLVAIALGLLVSAAIKSGVPILVARRDLHLATTRAPGRAGALFALSVLALAAVEPSGQPWLVAAVYTALGLLVLRPEIAEAQARLARRRTR